MKSWQGYCLTEASVNSALPDFVRPGETVFDVGSSVGDLSSMMSRLVGPFGKVVAFEANPNTAARAVDNFVANGLFNIFMVNRAIETVSQRRVTLHLSGPTGGVSDSLFAQPWNAGGGKAEIQSLALDDFIEGFGIEPSFIKFDIEGAETLALHGLQRYLTRKKPIIILEQSPESFTAIEIMGQHGYRCVDLHNYRILQSVKDYPTDCISVRNVACLHPDTIRWELRSYFENRMTQFGVYGNDDIAWTERDAKFPQIHLQPGRYILDARLEPRDGTLAIYFGVRDGEGTFLVLAHAVAGHFSGGRVELPFHIDEAQFVQPTIASTAEFAISEAVSGAAIVLHHVEGFGQRRLAQTVLGR